MPTMRINILQRLYDERHEEDLAAIEKMSREIMARVLGYPFEATEVMWFPFPRGSNALLFNADVWYAVWWEFHLIFRRKQLERELNDFFAKTVHLPAEISKTFEEDQTGVFVVPLLFAHWGQRQKTGSRVRQTV